LSKSELYLILFGPGVHDNNGNPTTIHYEKNYRNKMLKSKKNILKMHIVTIARTLSSQYDVDMRLFGAC